MTRAQELAAGCIHCGRCTGRCAFLQRHGLDLAGFAGREELSYHCFLCGDCAAVCPKGIDGRLIALSMRRQQVREAGGKVREKGYGALIAEKKNYLFRNYRQARPATFPRSIPKQQTG